MKQFVVRVTETREAYVIIEAHDPREAHWLKDQLFDDDDLWEEVACELDEAPRETYADVMYECDGQPVTRFTYEQLTKEGV